MTRMGLLDYFMFIVWIHGDYTGVHGWEVLYLVMMSSVFDYFWIHGVRRTEARNATSRAVVSFSRLTKRQTIPYVIIRLSIQGWG